MLVTYIHFRYGHYCSMKLERDFLTAEMDYSTLVMKNKVPAGLKFLLFHC